MQKRIASSDYTRTRGGEGEAREEGLRRHLMNVGSTQNTRPHNTATHNTTPTPLSALHTQPATRTLSLLLTSIIKSHVLPRCLCSVLADLPGDVAEKGGDGRLAVIFARRRGRIDTRVVFGRL